MRPPIGRIDEGGGWATPRGEKNELDTQQNSGCRDRRSDRESARRAAYDEIVRTYFAPPAHAEMMRVRELGNDAIRDAARRLY